MIVVAIIGLLASIAIPNFVKARATAQANTCIHNLHEIDAATQEWALENNQTQFATVSLAGITKYLGRITGGSLSACICPADPAQTFATSYTVTTVNVSPTCKHSFRHTHPELRARNKVFVPSLEAQEAQVKIFWLPALFAS